jgi:CheY-like chemotaxis protein
VRILLVDDEPDALEMMRFILEAEGATLTNVSLAREVLQQLEAGEFDLLISDVGMPEMDGYELIRKLRESISVEKLPAIALTGFASADDRARILEAGYQAHLPEPVNNKDLLAMILSLTRSSRSASSLARK